MSGKLRLPTLAGMVALALTLAGCGGVGSDTARAPGESGDSRPVAGAVSAAATEGATLRAELTALLREDVNLTAFTVHTAMASGFDSEATQAAIEALHHSGQALAREVASVSGASDSERGASEIDRFESHWGNYVQYVADYIEGAVASDAALKAEALRKLHEVEEELAIVLTDLTQGIISISDAHGLLGEHTGLLTTTIDAIAARDPAAPKDIVQTAEAAQKMAKELSRGLDLVPGERAGGGEGAGGEQVAGNPISEAATLRAQLTGYLVQHIAQTFVMAHLTAAAGPDSDRTAAAIETMHTNMERIAHEFEVVYGKSAAEEFTRLYEAHIKALVAYAEKAATEQGAATTTPSPTEFPKEFAGFAERVTDGHLRQHEFEAAVAEQLHAAEAAIETITKTSTAAAAEVEAAAGQALDPAELLSTAIVEQYPKEFTG